MTLEPIRADDTGWSAWRLRLEGLVEAFRFGIEEGIGDAVDDARSRRD